jgi:hypothetical protein
MFKAIRKVLSAFKNPSPAPENMFMDTGYEPDKWGYVIDEADTEGLKNLVRKTFAGLASLGNMCEFTPEEASRLGVSWQDMQLLDYLTEIFYDDMANRRRDSRDRRMVSMVRRVVDSGDTPDGEAEERIPYTEFARDMVDLGMMFVSAADNSDEFDLPKMGMCDFFLSLNFIWNFLVRLGVEMREDEQQQNLIMSDFDGFASVLTPEQISALIEWIGIVDGVEAPDIPNVHSTGNGDLE